MQLLDNIILFTVYFFTPTSMIEGKSSLKVDLIRHLRQHLGLGLKEAKDLSEGLEGMNWTVDKWIQYPTLRFYAQDWNYALKLISGFTSYSPSVVVKKIDQEAVSFNGLVLNNESQIATLKSNIDYWERKFNESQAALDENRNMRFPSRWDENGAFDVGRSWYYDAAANGLSIEVYTELASMLHTMMGESHPPILNALDRFATRVRNQITDMRRNTPDEDIPF